MNHLSKIILLFSNFYYFSKFFGNNELNITIFDHYNFQQESFFKLEFYNYIALATELITYEINIKNNDASNLENIEIFFKINNSMTA